MRFLVVLLPFAVCAGGDFRQSGFQADSGWQPWAAREEIAPTTFVDAVHSIGEPGSLGISGRSNMAAYGGWHRTLPVEAGHWYRLTAHYRAEGLTYEPLQVVARLDWQSAPGKRAGEPDYAFETQPGEWRKVTLEAPAPKEASGVTIQLYLANAPQATVWWDDIALEAIAAPRPRVAVVASINLRPRNTGSAAASVRQFIDTIERAVREKTDVILLPEGITVVGTGKKYAEIAETIPGPTTQALGEVARRRSTYVVAGIYERDGAAIYNTAVLIDRAGAVVGKYRKVYLPREEIEAGLTPGGAYPVFQTDFGKVGMMICYDVFYADAARALALHGAEMILMPIWGGNQTLAKARAIENRVFLVSSGYDYPTHIIDPHGEFIAAAPEQGTAAIARIDLNRRYPEEWLGDMRQRFFKELRLDVPVRME